MVARRVRKEIVENCFAISTRSLVDRTGGFTHSLQGVLQACRERGGGEGLSVSYTLVHRSGGPALLFDYVAAQQRVSYWVMLEATGPPFGGSRWWFVCPLQRAGSSCWKRVARLYLPARSQYFGCRSCHMLTYRSVQTPAIARYRRLCEALDGVASELNSPDRALRVAAVQAVQRLVRGGLESVDSAP